MNIILTLQIDKYTLQSTQPNMPWTFFILPVFYTLPVTYIYIHI